jgi:hypothetical protein
VRTAAIDHLVRRRDQRLCLLPPAPPLADRWPIRGRRIPPIDR